MRGIGIVVRVAVAAFVSALPSPADPPYREPDLKAEAFRVADLSLDAPGRERLATQLGTFVRNHLDLDTAPPRRLTTAARMLGVALRLDPRNKTAYVANLRLKEGAIPAPVEEAGETRAALTRRILAAAQAARRSARPADLKLAACLLGVLAEVCPDDDDVVFEAGTLADQGVTVDWSWAPESGEGGAARGMPVPFSAAAAPAGAAREFSRLQSTVRGLVVQALESGDLIGTAMDITATAAPEGRALAAAPASIYAPGDGDPSVPGHPRPAVKPPSVPGPIQTWPAVLRGIAGREMAISLQEAVRTAQVRHPVWTSRGVEISFGDKYNPKDGGSAGTAFTLLFLSLLDGFEIDPAFACTGDITVNGVVRKVGGVPEKVRGAVAGGCRVVAVPLENKAEVNDLLLLQGPAGLTGAQVVTVGTIDDAVALARRDRPERVAEALRRFAELQGPLKDRGLDYARTPGAKTALREIVALLPGHASADLLLQAAEGKNFNKLTVHASLSEMFAACHKVAPLIWIDDLPRGGSLRQYLPKKSVSNTRVRLMKLRTMVNGDVSALVPLLQKFVDELDVLADEKVKTVTARYDAGRGGFYGGTSASAADTWDDYRRYRQGLREKLETLGTDKLLMEKILRGE